MAAVSAVDAGAPSFGKGAARRVVITGMGVVSSLGHDTTEFYDNLLAGKSGISLIESFDACKPCCGLFYCFTTGLHESLFGFFFEVAFN
jgi:hypothetical protein